MKVLIVYSSAGTGHRRAAEAIYDSLGVRVRQDTRLVDILEFSPRFFKFIYSDGYMILIKYFPFIWSFLYYLTDKRCLSLIFSCVRNLVNYCFARKFYKFLKSNNPEVVVSTHFMPNEIVSDLKIKKELECFLISIITDYTAHSFWISKRVDCYVVALDKIKEILIKKGVNQERIEVLGIPVAKEFINLKNRQEAAKIIGVNPKEFCALLVTGTIGLNILEEIAISLKDEMQVMVICGNNHRLRERLIKLNSANLLAFPVVKNMHDFLAVADIIVTKAGGLTISESLSALRPMFFISKVNGQESENLTTLTSLGCGVYERSLEALAKRIKEVKARPQILFEMKQNLGRIAKPLANEQICKLISNHVR